MTSKLMNTANRTICSSSDARINPLPIFFCSWLLEEIGYLRRPVARQGFDNTVQTDKGADHTAGMDHREVRDVVEGAAEEHVVREGVDRSGVSRQSVGAFLEISFKREGMKRSADVRSREQQDLSRYEDSQIAFVAHRDLSHDEAGNIQNPTPWQRTCDLPAFVSPTESNHISNL